MSTNTALRYLQRNVQPRMLLVLMVASILLTVTAAYLYLFKIPVGDYKQSIRNFEFLQVELQQDAPLRGQIEHLQATIERLDREIHGNGPQLPVSQMMAFVIGQLDAIARRHHVQLLSVKPGTAEKIIMFREIPFNVEIVGTYFKLYDWLSEVEKTLGPLVVKQFEISPEAKAKERRMKLTIVSYRFEED